MRLVKQNKAKLNVTFKPAESAEKPWNHTKYKETEHNENEGGNYQNTQLIHTNLNLYSEPGRRSVAVNDVSAPLK